MSECYHIRASQQYRSVNSSKEYGILKRNNSKSTKNYQRYLKSVSVIDSSYKDTFKIVELDKIAKSHRSKILKIKTLESLVSYSIIRDRKSKLNNRALQYHKSTSKNRVFHIWNLRSKLSYGFSQLSSIFLHKSVQTSFIILRKNAIKSTRTSRNYSRIDKENSFDLYREKNLSFHMDDYELALNIKLLEKKLTALNQELSVEQINHHRLLSEKREIINFY